ncbi:MAG: deoxyguanosinetriphosphate triphosphohydrolase [Candidatus Nanopelagicales bacterium]
MATATHSGYTEHDEQRWVAESDLRPGRSAFARDRARVLHSAGLRRLAAKTQVLTAGYADFPRTRLTHTLEVAQIARELGAALGADPDIVDVAGLAHDLGHPPFGHNGEVALNEVAAHIGGFEGNAQTLRLLTRLEAKIWDPSTGRSVGLNLTRASLDASCKYPWARREGTVKFGYYADDEAVFRWLREQAPGERRCLEEQVMDWADDVAYSVHDIEDAFHTGMVRPAMFADAAERASIVGVAMDKYAEGIGVDQLQLALDRLRAQDFWPDKYAGTHQDLGRLKAMTSALIGRFCTAAELATRDSYEGFPLTRYHAELVVPEAVRAEVAVMKAVTAHYVMGRTGAADYYREQRQILTELAHELLLRGGADLEPWLTEEFKASADDAGRLRVVVDQVASLTDASAREWHRRICV